MNEPISHFPPDCTAELKELVRDLGVIADALRDSPGLSLNFIVTKKNPTENHGVVFIVLTGNYTKDEAELLSQTALTIVTDAHKRTCPDVPGDSQ